MVYCHSKIFFPIVALFDNICFRMTEALLFEESKEEITKRLNEEKEELKLNLLYIRDAKKYIADNKRWQEKTLACIVRKGKR